MASSSIASTASDKGKQPRVAPTRLFEYFDTLLTTYLPQGIEVFRFEPDAPLQVGRGGVMQPIPQVTLQSLIVTTFIKRIISLNQYKLYEEVDDDDIRMALGGKLIYDVVLQGPRGPIARGFKASVFKHEKGAGLHLELDPPFLVGYGGMADPGALNDEQLVEWFDDFATRMLARNNPRPKDVVFSPNKENPYVTVTGGLKPVEDVFIRGGATTERIARVLIRLANNPLVNEKVQKNGGRLQGLDLDMAYKTRAGRRFRVNVADSFDVEVDHGPLITMRILPDKPWTLDDLPLPRVVLDVVTNTRMGLVLISGTTGSGKSTTMGVLIDYLLKNKSINFLSIENPIETMFPARQYPRSIISQRELGKHTINLHKGLESAVRQTLSMAMVGEIRNAEDAAMALELAQSGHLIFATVHAGSTGESINRIVDMFPADQEKKIREMLAAQYRLGLAQILVKGVNGQTELVLEVMKTNPEIKLYMLKQQEPDRELSMRELLELYAETSGTQSMDQALVKLFKEGKISEDVMMYNSPDPEGLVLRQSKLGIKLSSRWDATGAQIAADTEQKLAMALAYGR
jgi:twitching motility protein PilT